MIKNWISIGLIPSALVFLAARPDWTSVSLLVATCSLYAFILFHEERKASDLDLLKDQIQEVKGKIDNLMLGRGLGR